MSIASQSSIMRQRVSLMLLLQRTQTVWTPKEIAQLACEVQTLESESTGERIAARCGSSAATTSSSTTTTSSSTIANDAIETASSCLVRCVIVILTSRLHELKW